jgi:uncharacterized membrane protein
MKKITVLILFITFIAAGACTRYDSKCKKEHKAAKKKGTAGWQY